MRYRSACKIILLALMLCGCDQQSIIQKFTLPAHDKAARSYFEDVRVGNCGPVLAAIDPAYRDQINADLCKGMRDLFGPHSVKGITVIGAQIMAQKLMGQSGFTLNSLTYEYDMGDRFVIANAVLRENNGRMQIEGIHAQALSRSIEQINAFTFSGKGVLFFIFLALAVLIPIFVIVSAIICWRTPIPRFKWLWRIFTLLGICGLTLNWTTGNLQFLPIHVTLLGAAVTQQPYSPWILEISIPLGAMLFWIMRKKWLQRAKTDADNF